jgi:hypothetical protein
MAALLSFASGRVPIGGGTLGQSHEEKSSRKISAQPARNIRETSAKLAPKSNLTKKYGQ